MCALLSLLVLRGDVGFDCISPDHCLSIFLSESLSQKVENYYWWRNHMDQLISIANILNVRVCYIRNPCAL